MNPEKWEYIVYYIQRWQMSEKGRRVWWYPEGSYENEKTLFACCLATGISSVRHFTVTLSRHELPFYDNHGAKARELWLCAMCHSTAIAPTPPPSQPNALWTRCKSISRPPVRSTFSNPLVNPLAQSAKRYRNRYWRLALSLDHTPYTREKYNRRAWPACTSYNCRWRWYSCNFMTPFQLNKLFEMWE